MFFAGATQISASAIYLYGTIKTDPNNQQNYGVPYYEFVLSVESSNEGNMTYPHNATVLVDATLYRVYNYSWAIGSKLNVTGVYIGDQPQVWSPPLGYFLASSVQMENATQNNTGWRATLDQLVTAISSIGKLLITLVVQVVFQIAGYQTPEWVVAGIIVLFAGIFLIRYLHKLPWIVVFIGAALIVSIILYMLTPMMGLHL